MTVYEVIDKEIKELAWYKKPCMIGVGELSRGKVVRVLDEQYLS